MTDTDWEIMRGEAAIVVELLRALTPKDPQVPDLIERAKELIALGIEAQGLAAVTEEGTRH
jgi:hypothetical protein